MEFIVDVQGFKQSLNSFVFKEVTILSVEDDAVPTVFYFEPPHRWNLLSQQNKCSNRWLERNFHGISWKFGDIPYKKLKNTLEVALVGAKKIYVKGIEKRAWLKQVLDSKYLIINLEDLGCPSLKKLPKNEEVICNNHTHAWKPVCAVQNAAVLRTWLIQHRLENSRRDSTWTGINMHWEGGGVDEVDGMFNMNHNTFHSMYN